MTTPSRVRTAPLTIDTAWADRPAQRQYSTQYGLETKCGPTDLASTQSEKRNQALRVGRESGNNYSRGLTPKAVAPRSSHALSTHLSALGLPTTSPTQPHNLWVVRVGAACTLLPTSIRYSFLKNETYLLFTRAYGILRGARCDLRRQTAFCAVSMMVVVRDHHTHSRMMVTDHDHHTTHVSRYDGGD